MEEHIVTVRNESRLQGKQIVDVWHTWYKLLRKWLLYMFYVTLKAVERNLQK